MLLVRTGMLCAFIVGRPLKSILSSPEFFQGVCASFGKVQLISCFDTTVKIEHAVLRPAVWSWSCCRGALTAVQACFPRGQGRQLEECLDPRCLCCFLELSLDLPPRTALSLSLLQLAAFQRAAMQLQCVCEDHLFFPFKIYILLLIINEIWTCSVQ